MSATIAGVRRMGVVGLACAAACAIAVSGGAAASQQSRAGVFTGYGFDACTAPSIAALTAWSASPYRALGIYIGGVNRACGDGNLSASWVATVGSMGWSLLPLYVGLQAPCVSQAKLGHISTNAGTAGTQGIAAADDAAVRAATFALPAAGPIYFDMEGYKTDDPACTKSVQAFVGGWVTELHTRGFVAGVYGSAASTIRDISVLGVNTPDDAWIANWNGVAAVFGDPYVSDSLWPNHQRVHQFKGGHKETYAGVTINIDGDFVDGAVVGGSAPPPPPPPPPAGSVGSGDSQASVSWPSGAFSQPVVVALTPVNPVQPPAVYAVQLTVTQADGTTPVTSFAAPLVVHFVAQGGGLVPAISTDGATWTPVTGYAVEADGSFDVSTSVPGFFGLIPDATPPSQPQSVAGRFSHGSLLLTWQPSKDNGGVIASYRVLLDGAPLLTTNGTVRHAVVRSFHPAVQTVYRVQAVDPAGNESKPSKPLVVLPTPRPANVPRPLPGWAWTLLAWQHGGGGTRPAKAPHRPPAWYWSWSAWRLQPFHLRR